MVDEYLSFLSNLVSAQTVYLRTCLKMVVSNFIPGWWSFLLPVNLVYARYFCFGPAGNLFIIIFFFILQQGCKSMRMMWIFLIQMMRMKVSTFMILTSMPGIEYRIKSFRLTN